MNGWNCDRYVLFEYDTHTYTESGGHLKYECIVVREENWVTNKHQNRICIDNNQTVCAELQTLHHTIRSNGLFI